MQTPLPSALPPSVRKAHEVVMAKSEGEFTLLDRKVLNVLLARAYKNLGGPAIHRISMKDLIDLFSDSGRAGPIKESLERLWKQSIAIDYIDEDGHPRSLRCHYLSFDLCHIEAGYLDYAFDKILMRFIHNPKVYSIIQLDTVRRFKTAGGLKLYEQMIAYYGRHHPVWVVSLNEAHDFFEATGIYRTRFDRFRERVVDVAVREVNNLSGFDVAVEYDTSGRGGKIVGLKFSATPKTDERIASPANGPPVWSKRRDENTVDMFMGASDKEYFAPPMLRDDTLAEGRIICGSDANVLEKIQVWHDEFGRRGYGSDPDETFLAWLRMDLAHKRDPEVQDLDVTAIFENLMGDA